jgi:hypothetical protein
MAVYVSAVWAESGNLFEEPESGTIITRISAEKGWRRNRLLRLESLHFLRSSKGL